jgi:CheY-like chemotaxis protein
MFTSSARGCGLPWAALNDCKDRKETNVKIAALEDNPARIMVLERALQPGGHHLARFRCGQPLVDAIHREPFDMLLLDRDVADTDRRTARLGPAHARTRAAVMMLAPAMRSRMWRAA